MLLRQRCISRRNSRIKRHRDRSGGEHPDDRLAVPEVQLIVFGRPAGRGEVQ